MHYAEGELVSCTLRKELQMKHSSVCISELFINRKEKPTNATNHVRLHLFSISDFLILFSRDTMHVNLVIVFTKLQLEMDPGLVSVRLRRLIQFGFSFSSSFVTVPQP